MLAQYQQQSDDEWVAEDEAAYESTTHAAMGVPVDLVPQLQGMLFSHDCILLESAALES